MYDAGQYQPTQDNHIPTKWNRSQRQSTRITSSQTLNSSTSSTSSSPALWWLCHRLLIDLAYVNGQNNRQGWRTVYPTITSLSLCGLFYVISIEAVHYVAINFRIEHGNIYPEIFVWAINSTRLCLVCVPILALTVKCTIKYTSNLCSIIVSVTTRHWACFDAIRREKSSHASIRRLVFGIIWHTIVVGSALHVNRA